MTTAFRLTYASMFDPPETLHERFEQALETIRTTGLGRTHAMLIDNRDVASGETFDNRSPINREWLLGRVQAGTRDHADAAVAAARRAFPAWSATPWRERVGIIRRVCDTIESRLYELGAATSLNVGKTRMESLADVQEAADLMRITCDWMERNDGYSFQQASEPLAGYTVRNMSVLKPHGVWLVISPFNFPPSLTCAPAGAALAAGNTVVTKPSPETSWVVRLLAECFRDAGVPDGVFNLVTGKDDEMGRTLVEHPGIDGVTFTGSHAVGMDIYRKFAAGPYPRPVVLEMGGKNATIVSRNADLDEAATGVVRAAFGTAGQKCSCTSRVYVEAAAYEPFLDRVVTLTKALRVGDPTRRDVYVGPLISARAFGTFTEVCSELATAGRLLTGGRTLTDGNYAHGYYAEPTVVADVPYTHRCWRDELFVPLVTIGQVDDLDAAIAMTNDTVYGLTGGFFGTPDETKWYFDRIQVGTAYANRSQGSSTGAWPGYQSFGGWKGSGASGKGTGSPYYIFSYLREQSQTIVTRDATSSPARQRSRSDG